MSSSSTTEVPESEDPNPIQPEKPIQLTINLNGLYSSIVP